jgi:hypothetical protein
MMRLEPALLFPEGKAGPARIEALVFLEGFAPRPLARRIEPGRVELTRLQPLAGSLVNASRRQRVFQMAQLLARTRVYGLRQGDPDASACWLEETAPTWE